MGSWSIDTGTNRLRRDGVPAFLLADTVWAAFTTPTEQEWRDYVELRQRQGFNAVAICIAPIVLDNSGGIRTPFLLRADGSPDVGALDDAYFSTARAFLDIARGHGLAPVLVVLWNNYVPGTWGSRITPALAMTEAQSDQWVDRCLAEFAEFEPIWMVSGDDHLVDEVALERYASAAQRIRTALPDALISMHSGTSARMADDCAAALPIDFYTYQSGHEDGWETRGRELSAHYRTLAVRRPMLNLEPAYEGHATGDGARRHAAIDVRQSSWLGIVSGAGAGLGYGAHGVWQWHRRHARFSGEWFSGTPYPVSIALQFEGAWDAGYTRELVERHELYDLDDRTDLIRDNRSAAVLGATSDLRTVAVYARHPFALSLDLNGAYEVTCYNLSARRVERVRTTKGTEIEQPEFVGDALYVLVRRTEGS